MKKFIILLIIFVFSNLNAADFETTEDNYFGYSGTKIDWMLSTGFSGGIATGYLDQTDGSHFSIEVLRLTARSAAPSSFFEYIYLEQDLNFYSYENLDDGFVYDIFSPQWTLGAAFNLGSEGFLEDIVPYVGGGIGIAMYNNTILGSKTINSDDEDSDSGSDGMLYIQCLGLEYKATSFIHFFIEERFVWGTYNASSDGYIPDEYGDSGNVIEYARDESTFKQIEVDVRQLTIEFGVRLNWGRDLF